MSLFIKEEYFNENDYTFLYQYNSADEFQLRIDKIMAERGYRNIGSNIYEKGNGTLRMLLGAFYKHYKMEITPESIGPHQVRVRIKKRSSGFAGGAIGMSQIQKELRALKDIFISL